MNTNNLNNQWALITGASSGIGYAYAEELASRRFNLVIVSNEEIEIQAKGKLLAQKYQVDVVSLCQDLAIPNAAEVLYTTCREKDIQIEVLINNAGMFYFKEFVEVSSSLNEKILYLHIQTPTQLCYYFGQDMKQRRHGYILNMSSMSAWLPYPGINIYASTKRYLKDFSRALHSELQDYNVHVTVLCPGAVCTNLYNLSDNLKQLAIRLGIMMLPETLAQKGINALLHRKSVLLPGLLNKVMLPLVLLLPRKSIHRLMRKSGLLPVTR